MNFNKHYYYDWKFMQY